MGVIRITIPKYIVLCDRCGFAAEVLAGGRIYNAAQAVRSLKWSYGRDGSVICCHCRITLSTDHYRDRIYNK